MTNILDKRQRKINTRAFSFFDLPPKSFSSFLFLYLYDTPRSPILTYAGPVSSIKT